MNPLLKPKKRLFFLFIRTAYRQIMYARFPVRGVIVSCSYLELSAVISRPAQSAWLSGKIVEVGMDKGFAEGK